MAAPPPPLRSTSPSGGGGHFSSRFGGGARRAEGVWTRGLWLALLALFALLAPAAHAELKFPPLTGRVVDAANVLPAPVRADLDAKLAALETQTGHQLVVATLPDLQGTDIADYGYQLGRAWGIGQKGKNDGAILIVAPAERKLRIEVGYGLEPVLTDALSSIIINEAIVPKFKAGDLPGGIVDGVNALVQQLSLPDDQARANVAQASAAKAQDDARAQHRGRGGAGSWVWILFILAFFVLPRLFGGRRGGGGLGWLPFIFLGGGGGGGGGWGGGGDNGGGGGGFSGGGGSFGGGGSSGSW